MLRLNKKIKNEIFPVTFDDFEEGGGGRGGGGGAHIISLRERDGGQS